MGYWTRGTLEGASLEFLDPSWGVTDVSLFRGGFLCSSSNDILKTLGNDTRVVHWRYTTGVCKKPVGICSKESNNPSDDCYTAGGLNPTESFVSFCLFLWLMCNPISGKTQQGLCMSSKNLKI